MCTTKGLLPSSEVDKTWWSPKPAAFIVVEQLFVVLFIVVEQLFVLLVRTE